MKPFAIYTESFVYLDMKNKRKKPTNKELVEGISFINQKLDRMFRMNANLFRDYVDFQKNVKKFQKFLEKRYEQPEEAKESSKEQDTKKSS